MTLPYRPGGTYFVSAATPSTPARYHLLAADGYTVVSVIASRPDGREVERPAGLRYNLQPWNGGTGHIDHRRAVAYFQAAPHLANRTLKCGRCGERKLAQAFPFDSNRRRSLCGNCTSTRNRRNGASLHKRLR